MNKNLVRLFIVVILNLMIVPLSVAKAPEMAATGKICEILLNATRDVRKNQLPQDANKVDLLGADRSTIQRIGALLSTMSPGDRHNLYQGLADIDFRQLSLSIKDAKKSNLQKTLDKDPALAMMLTDLIIFGETFPSIFKAKKDSGTVNYNEIDQGVTGLINLVQEQEVKTQVSGYDILKSQSAAPRLRRAISNMIANLITQASSEYDGLKFGKTWTEHFFYRVTRFFFPTFKPVRRLVEAAQQIEAQTERLRDVDAIVIDQIISRMAALELTEEEKQQALALVLDSEDDLDELIETIKKVFGESFQLGPGIEIGRFDIYAADKRLKNLDIERIRDLFDKMNVRPLDIADAILDKALVRQGKKPRDPDQYPKQEVILRAEAAKRQADRALHFYGQTTDQKSNESYTVWVQHYKLVSKTDSHGKEYTDWEPYTAPEPRTPTFEDILTENYEFSIHGVQGDDDIKARAATMVAKETPVRQLSQRVSEFVSNLMINWYEETVSKGGSDDLSAKLAQLYSEVTSAVVEQEKYSKWSESQILNQYSHDSTENFRARNTYILSSLKQDLLLLTMLSEALRRKLPDIRPFFDHFDYSDWMAGLQRQHNIARGVQATVLGAVSVYGGHYVYQSPEARQFLAEHGKDMVYILLNSLNALNHAASHLH